MMRASLLLSLALACVTLAPRAHAFCQTTTCDPSDLEQTCDRDAATRCVTSGQGLFWASSCLTISVQRDGAPNAGIDYDAAKASVERAFAAWTDVDCNGKSPSLRVEISDPVECGKAEYSTDRHNANVVLFREDEWPYVGAEDALGLTTLSFDTENITGEIYDVDIEINALSEPLSVGEPGPREVDLDSLLTHEAGHALGLGHTLDDAASMRIGYTPGSMDLRTLSRDDMAGMCGIYAPIRSTSSSSCEPRHGFSELCGADQPDMIEPEPEPEPTPPDTSDNAIPSSCGIGPARASHALPWAALLLGALGVARARSSRSRHQLVGCRPGQARR